MTHAVLAALAVDDLDRAITSGLLQDTSCADCSDACKERLIAARNVRLYALAARERHRARDTRLALRTHEREQRRADRRASAGAIAVNPLPPAAAAALARAKAKAAAK